MPLGVPIPPSPDASQALLAAFAERGIGWHPSTLVPRARSGRARSPSLSDGSEMPYDLFLGVPVHRAPAVVAASGLTVDGWIPVDPLTLRDAVPRRLRRRRRHQRRAHRRPACSPRARPRSVGRPRSPPGSAGDVERADVRRARHLLPRVRPRPGRQGRRHLRQRQAPHGHARGPVAGAGRRQGRVRHEPHPALVRPRLGASV